jgi:hypothetical protein
MALVITATVGLVIWIALWALEPVSGFDAMIIGLALVLAVSALRNVVPYFQGRKEK